MEHGKPIVLPYCDPRTIQPQIFADDSAGTFNFIVSGTGPDYVAQYNSSASFCRTNGILLATRTTAPAVDDFVSIVKRIWYPPNQKLRLQYLFAPYDSTRDLEFSAIINTYDGTYAKTAYVQVGVAENFVGIYTYSATLTQIPGATWCRQDSNWNSLDLSVDLSSLAYKTLAINNQVYDLSAYTMHYAASGTLPRAQFQFLLTTKVANISRVYLDQILVTPENR